MVVLVGLCLDCVYVCCVNSVDLILHLILNLKYAYAYYFGCVLFFGCWWLFGYVVAWWFVLLWVRQLFLSICVLLVDALPVVDYLLVWLLVAICIWCCSGYLLLLRLRGVDCVGLFSDDVCCWLVRSVYCGLLLALFDVGLL